MALSRKIELYEKDNTKNRKSKRNSRSWLQHVDAWEFLETLDVSNIQSASSDELLFSCPFPGHSSGDSKPSAYMNNGAKEKNRNTAWKCHGCGRSGNAISFYAEHNGISKQEAAAHIKAIYAPNFRAPEGGITEEFERRLRERDRRVEEEPQPVIPADVYDDKFGVDWPTAWAEWLETQHKRVGYLFERGFEPETLMDWNIGFCERTDRYTIPICEPDGTIIGVKARSWKSKEEEKIRYLILGDKPNKRKRYGWTHYEKSKVIFGLHMVPEGTDTLVLVEGELDVLALWQVGIPAISTGSAHLSEIQARIIRQHCDHCIVFYDTNDAGEHATWGWYDKDDTFHPGVVQDLEPFIRLSIVPDHEGDASQMVQDKKTKALKKLVASAQSTIRLAVEDML